MTEDLKVGEKIKLLREKKKLSLPDLAQKSGFSSAILSQIENHMISPPLGTIIKLAKALEVEPGYFFKEKPKSPYVIVRKDERVSVSRVASKEGVSYGYSYESLGADKKDRKMEPFIVTLDPESVKKARPVHPRRRGVYLCPGRRDGGNPGRPFGRACRRRFDLLQLDHSPPGGRQGGFPGQDTGRPVHRGKITLHEDFVFVE